LRESKRGGGAALIAVILGFVFLASAGAQQEAKERVVKAIEIQGLKSVSDQVVRSQLEVQVGQPFNPSAVARDIRRLYSLGHFDSIKVDAAEAPDGITLTYTVQEKRIIDSIKIMGTDKIRASKVRGVLSWKEGDSFSPDAYDEERAAILKLYEEKGFANTTVDISVEEVGPSRVRVTYAITEGKKARIRSVTFEGNQVLSERKLRKGMKTKPAWWFLGGKYNEDKFETDLKSVLDKYGDVGHLEAAIVGTDITYSPNGKKMAVKIRIAEGPQFKVGEIETANNAVFDDDEIMGEVKVHAGDVHNKGQVAKDSEALTRKYHDSGYVNTTVTPQVTFDRENKTSHLVYNVKEGDLKYVKEIDITGNTVTRDDVIRRDIMIAPGERFDGNLVKLSQQRIENTRYFEKTRLTLRDVDDLYSDLVADVEEGKTGNFLFGVGYSSEEQIGGFGELRLNNFDITNWPKLSGGGQIFSLRLNVGSVRKQYNLSFTDPEIGGYPVAFGFDAFDESYRFHHSSNYTEETAGGQIRFGKALSPFVTARTALRYTDVDYSNIDDFAKLTEEWKEEFEETRTMSNSWSIERNTVDIIRDPTKGGRHELVGTIAGPGGDNYFYRLEHDSTWYFSLDEKKKWVLSLRTREGWMDEYGPSDRIPLSERFFAGGTSTVRGYDYRDIGPRIPEFRNSDKLEPIGGKLRLVNNVEMRYRLSDILRLYTFVDSGGVWRDVGDFDFGDMRYSAGIGLGVDIPRMGPVRVDYGVPINPDEDQGHGRLHLMTGIRF